MKNLKENKGITLVALVVTIIILLILAGVTIAQLTGNGLFEKAKEAKQKSESAQELENAILADYEGKINEYVDGTRGELTTINSENFETFSGTVVTNETPHDTPTIVNSYTVQKSGMYYILGRAGYNANTTATGYAIYRIKINNITMNADQRNSVYYHYTGFNVSYVTFLNEGDIVTTEMHQKASDATISLDYNLLYLNPIYYAK